MESVPAESSERSGEDAHLREVGPSRAARTTET